MKFLKIILLITAILLLFVFFASKTRFVNNKNQSDEQVIILPTPTPKPKEPELAKRAETIKSEIVNQGLFEELSLPAVDTKIDI